MNTSVFVNASLRYSAQNCHETSAGELKVWRFLEDWWRDWQESLSRSERRRQDAGFEELRRLNAEDKRKREERERDEEFVTLFLLSENDRRLRALQDDIDNAIKAAQHAFRLALRDAQAAQASLEDARRRALVLPDGRRVYFASDGRLYSEDGAEIGDAAQLEGARRERASNASATDYESYLEKVRKADETNARLEQIGETLQRLKNLKERAESGNISSRTLADARKEFDETIRSMRPEIREEYDRLRAARSSEVSADQSAPSTQTILHADFARAAEAFEANNSQSKVNPRETAEPAYKDAPDF